MSTGEGKRGFSPWHTLIIAALVVFLAVAGGAAWFAWQATKPAVTVTLTREFKEYIPTVGSTDGILETATCSVPESFTQSDSAWLFNVIPLGTNVAEIRVPAIYRYHINLLDTWKVEARGSVCVVSAPQFTASLPPAILTGQMEKSTSAGWLRFDAQESMAALERGITEELTKRADDATHREYVREASREAVADFVKSWLMRDDAWREDRFHQIVVVFPDEPAAKGMRDYRPTLRLDGTEQKH